ncbi:MAG: hypothetical protein R3F61_06815 [Myxococcota bacterium]
MLALFTLLACGESPMGVNEIGPDWLEIYNPSDVDVSFEGWEVGVDDQVWAFDPVPVPPMDVGMLANGSEVSGGWSMALELPIDGAEITVWDDRGRVRQEIVLPPFEAGTSFGRVPDGAPNWQVLDTPSPGDLNGD